MMEPELEDRLRRGLALLAEQTPPPRTRRPWIPAAAAAVVLLAGAGVGLALAGDDQPPTRQTAPPTATQAPPIGQGLPYDLTRLVAESPRIVVGTVDQVTHGAASDASGGMPYVMAEVSVDRTLKGPETERVVAFDYEYGGTVTAGGSSMGSQFREGERVLLFLSSVEGTVHAGLAPPHWQVSGGAAGKYRMRGDEPEASFTLEQVERAVRA